MGGGCCVWNWVSACLQRTQRRETADAALSATMQGERYLLAHGRKKMILSVGFGCFGFKCLLGRVPVHAL
eukprot:1143253-Pelagomonas_calceolata.AAC.6